jgi:hypothetical protein
VGDCVGLVLCYHPLTPLAVGSCLAGLPAATSFIYYIVVYYLPFVKRIIRDGLDRAICRAPFYGIIR